LSEKTFWEIVLVKFVLRDVGEMARLAGVIAAGLGPGCNLLLLRGQMGTGKTTFVKALARALGVDELVVSPTFVMMNEYLNGRVPVYHVDLYRMGEIAESGDGDAENGLGSLDFLVAELDEISKKDSLIAIEWAELMDRNKNGREFITGHEHLALDFQYVTNSDLKRLAVMDSFGTKFTKLLLAIEEGFGDMMEDS